MKLHLPEIMDVLETKPFAMMMPDGALLTFERKNKHRGRITQRLLPLMHEAQKFIFDSGSDQDPKVVQIYRDTALAMLETNTFHLPFPVIWVEDPFSDETSHHDLRFYYLAKEHPDHIELYHITRLPKTEMRDDIRYLINGCRMVIDKVDVSDKFTILDIDTPPDPIVGKSAAEAVYGLKKFLVAISISDTVRDKVPGSPYKASLPKKFRKYPYTVIRIPEDDTEADTVIGEARESHPGTKKRKHLVMGYTWGKHTRSQDEWRLIKPYWRGSQEIIERDHYEVR